MMKRVSIVGLDSFEKIKMADFDQCFSERVFIKNKFSMFFPLKAKIKYGLSAKNLDSEGPRCWKLKQSFNEL